MVARVCYVEAPLAVRGDALRGREVAVALALTAQLPQVRGPVAAPYVDAVPPFVWPAWRWDRQSINQSMVYLQESYSLRYIFIT